MSRRGRDEGPSARPLRVGEEIRHVLADVLARGELRDPALAACSITVTEVRMSPDLRRATAYVLPFGGNDTEGALAGLARASARLRHEVGRRVRLRYVPELAFETDTTFDHAGHIDRLLHAIAPSDGDDGTAA